MLLKTYYKLTLLLLLLTPWHTYATEQPKNSHPVDIKLSQCLNSDHAKSHQINCLGNAIDEWDKVLNKSYKKLISNLNEEQKLTVRESQRQWIIYRDSQIKAINSMYDGTWGTASLSRMAAIMDLTKDKATELHEYAINIENETY